MPAIKKILGFSQIMRYLEVKFAIKLWHEIIEIGIIQHFPKHNFLCYRPPTYRGILCVQWCPAPKTQFL